MTTFESLLTQPGNLGAITFLVDWASAPPEQKDERSLDLLFEYLNTYPTPSVTSIGEVSRVLHLRSDNAPEPAKNLYKLASFYFDAVHSVTKEPRTIRDLNSLTSESTSPFLTRKTFERFVFDTDLTPMPPTTRMQCRAEYLLPYNEPFLESANLLRDIHPLLELAAKCDSTPCIRKLHSLGGSVTFPLPNQSENIEMLPPIFSAVKADSDNAILTMDNLRAHADSLDSPYKFGEEWVTPLGFAAYAGRQKSTRALLELGASPNSIAIKVNGEFLSSSSPMFKAASRENWEVLRQLCKAPNCNLDEQNANGHTVAQVAAKKDNVLILDDLHKLGVDLQSARGGQKETPLHIACKNSNLAAAGYLSRKCPKALEMRDSIGRTPAIIATQIGNIAMLKTLKGAGADLSVMWQGKTLKELVDPEKDPQLYSFFT
ncbi:MAG: hypothetical protein S4CHLAM6_02600 [Chlamydiae bacterium]|nr:hypothetical protein [Chlamydiota bacterium]